MNTAYLAPEGFEKDLERELQINEREVLYRAERLFVVRGSGFRPAWAQNIWFHVERLEFESVAKAAAQLKERGRFWNPYFTKLHRRGGLIQDKTAAWKIKPIGIKATLSNIPLGSWHLESENALWASADCSSPYPNGEVPFAEDDLAPSKASLKLREFFLTHNNSPKAGERCLDLGACPGGWTWVLANLGAEVIAVDKAPLDEKVMKLDRVQYLKKDAFKLKPDEIGPVDWLFSDVICYPEKLFDLVNLWMDSGLVKNFVCTIKFQGPTDFETLQKFKSIKGSKTEHLSVNKHELTWSLIGD